MIVDLVFQKRNSLKTHAESKACILVRVDAAHSQHVGMNRTASQDLDPAGAFAETASFASAFEAGYVTSALGSVNGK